MATDGRSAEPEALKGLAHPIRRQLFRQLAQFGPATAGVLAKRAELDPGLISYHLRELHRRGFIEEATELARDRRERWWRVLPGTKTWSFLDFREPESRALANAVKAQMVADELERLRLFERSRDTWPEEWQDAAVASETYVRLTAAELTGLAAELQLVVKRWAEKGRSPTGGQPDSHPSDGDDSRQQVFIFLHAFPERP